MCDCVNVVAERRRPADSEQTKLKLINSPTSSDAAYRPGRETSEDRDKPRPVPKPRTASTSSTLDVVDDTDTNVKPSDVMKPRPRTRGSQQSLDEPPPSQESMDERRPRAHPRGSVESLERIVDQRKDNRPTPALRGSQESLDSIGKPKPRARAPLDRSLDESELSQRAHQPTRPQVAHKPAKKTARKDKAVSNDETDV